MLHGIGYAFLFRNYRAETGKWMSSDPLGYPDGWNNLAYCGNAATSGLDPLGLAWEADIAGTYANRAVRGLHTPGKIMNAIVRNYTLP